MSQNSQTFRCTPDDVFKVLADGWTYASWVVGAARIRDVDENWPEVGSEIHHSVGAWPLLISDRTTVESIQVPHQLVLKVRAWPAGAGRVRITCEPIGAETRVTMEETAIAGPARLLTPVQDAILRVRNREALRRLGFIAENANQRRSGNPPAVN